MFRPLKGARPRGQAEVHGPRQHLGKAQTVARAALSHCDWRPQDVRTHTEGRPRGDTVHAPRREAWGEPPTYTWGLDSGLQTRDRKCLWFKVPSVVLRYVAPGHSQMTFPRAGLTITFI